MNFKQKLGKVTWKFLHTFAKGFDSISKPQASHINNILTSLFQVYPCKLCRSNLKRHLRHLPINTTSGHNLRQFLCKLHNRVNKSLNKPLYNCKLIN